MKNQVWKREIDEYGNERMILVEEYDVENQTEVLTTVEELQQKIDVLQIQLTDVQQHLEQLTGDSSLINF